VKKKRPNSLRRKDPWPEVNDKQWLDQGDGHGVRVIRDSDPVPEEACINVPHPVRKDLRIVICVIASIVVLACVVAPMLGS
jgi:hypothetical protein